MSEKEYPIPKTGVERRRLCLCWMNDMRKQIKEEMPDLDRKEVNELASHMWKTVGAKEIPKIKKPKSEDSDDDEE